jgi:hypothetical protein
MKTKRYFTAHLRQLAARPEPRARKRSPRRKPVTPLRQRIVDKLHRYGPMTFYQLRRCVGVRAYGPYAMRILSYWVRWSGLSLEFGDALEALILTGHINVDPTLKIQLGPGPTPVLKNESTGPPALRVIEWQREGAERQREWLM